MKILKMFNKCNEIMEQTANSTQEKRNSKTINRNSRTEKLGKINEKTHWKNTTEY